MLSIREVRERAVIRPVKRAVEDQLLDLPGVTAVDIGPKNSAGRRTAEQVIVVSVMRKRPLQQLPRGTRVPADILGIPTDVVEERPVLHHRHCSPFPLNPPEQGGATLRGGSGIAPSRAVRLRTAHLIGEYRRVGTLGLLVLGNRPATVPMGLTTFDVACLDDAWAIGDRMIDPGSGLVYADLARAALSSRVDAAAVTIRAGLAHAFDIAGIGRVAGRCGPHPGAQVRKHGHGTGLTEGKIESTDATVRVDHGEALGVRVLREQMRVRGLDGRFAGPGDSGSAVVDSSGRVVGLHVAGSEDGRTGFASPIADVLAELDVQLCLASPHLS